MNDQQRMSPLATYLDFCREGKLAYQWCPGSGKPVFFPREISPHTGQANLEWRVSKGDGTVYSFTVVHRKDEPPSCIALIDLDEGFRMMSRLEDAASDTPSIGMRVRMKMHFEAGQEPLPVFVRAER